MITSIQTCIYWLTEQDKRTHNSKKGLLINEHFNCYIIDSFGNKIESLYDYKPVTGIQLFDLKIG
jgi:hypothetical protein